MVGYTEMLKVVENNHTTCEKKKKKKSHIQNKWQNLVQKGSIQFHAGSTKEMGDDSRNTVKTVSQKPQRTEVLQIHRKFKEADHVKRMNLIHLDTFNIGKTLLSSLCDNPPCRTVWHVEKIRAPLLSGPRSNRSQKLLAHSIVAPPERIQVHTFFSKLSFAFQCPRSSTSQSRTYVYF